MGFRHGRQQTCEGQNNNARYFIAGAMLAVIVVLGIMFIKGNLGGHDEVDINIQAPKVEAPKQ